MATRRSARFSAKAESTPVAIASSSDSESTKRKTLKRRPRKQQKLDIDVAASTAVVQDRTDYSRVRGRRGHLKLMTEMPVDILLEIFSRLEPIDLLHLSRASKILHNLLTSSNSTYIWRLAYKNIRSTLRPPPCLDNINIIYYTNCIYGRHCQFCGSIYGRLTHDTALVRYCSKCADEIMVHYTLDLNHSAFELCNAAKDRTWRTFVLQQEYLLRCKELAKAKTENRLDAYIDERRAIVRDRASQGKDLHLWRSRLQVDKDQKHREILSKRQEDIFKKLSEEGYGDVLHKWKLRRALHVRKGQALTDSEWLRIRADLIDIVQPELEEKLRMKVVNRFENGITLLQKFIHEGLNDMDRSVPFIMPPVSQIASSEPVYSVFKSAPTRDLSMEDFRGLKAQIFEFIMSWKEETDQLLASLLPCVSKGKKKVYTSQIELATTFFICHQCAEPIAYPRILVHKCLIRTSARESHVGDKNGSEEVEEIAGNDLVQDKEADLPRRRRQPPRQPKPPKEITLDTELPSLAEVYNTGIQDNMGWVKFNHDAYGTAREIIKACGEDPDIITSAEMQRKDVRIECLRCCRDPQDETRRSATRLVMTWTMAVLHNFEYHKAKDSINPAWRMVHSKKDMSKIKRKESKFVSLRGRVKILCKHCRLAPSQDITLLGHLRLMHGIDAQDADLDLHYVKDLDTPMALSQRPIQI